MAKELELEGKVAPSSPVASTPGTARSSAPLVRDKDESDVPMSGWQLTMARVIVEKPKHLFFGTTFVIVLLSAIIGGTGLMTFSDPTQHDWTIASNIESQRLDAWSDAVSQTDKAGGGDTVEPRSEDSSSFTLITAWKDGREEDIFTPELVQDLCELENLIFEADGYDKVCKLDYNTPLADGEERQCTNMHPYSIAAAFYGMKAPRECTLLSADKVNAVRSGMYAAMANATTSMQYAYFMSAAFDPATHDFTERTRSTITLGAPLDGYSSAQDDEDAQRKVYENFYEGVEQKLWTRFGLAHTFFKSAYEAEAVSGPFQFKWFAAQFQNMEFNRIVNSDLAWTTGSILFVFFYMTVHIGSAVLSSISLLQIVLSLPVSFFIYRLVFQIPFFTQLHVLAIFLVLGVGADDVFVFVDAWKQSAQCPPRISASETTRMYYAYSRTVSAVFNTSFTTAMAFVSTAISPIMPISSFGIYAALSIVLNYLFVITVTPPLVILWERHVQPLSCAAKCQGAEDTGRGDGTPASAGDDTPVVDEAGQDKDGPRPASSPKAGDDAPAPEKVRRSEYFFEHVWAPLLLRRVKVGSFEVKPLPLVMFLVLGAFAAFCASKAAELRPPSEEEAWFADDHMFTGLGDELSNEYKAGTDDSYRRITVVFGIDGIDRSDYNIYKPGENRGSAVFASTDLASAAFQKTYTKACNDLLTAPCSAQGCLDGKLLLPDSTVSCVVPALYAWMNDPALSVGDLEGDQYVAKLIEFRATPQARAQRMVDMIGIIDGKLKFMTMQFTSSMQKQQPGAIGEPVHDEIEAFLNNKVDVKPVYQVAGREWTWMVTQGALVSNMFTGLSICFPVAFLVLIMATGNIILAFYAVLSIALIVCVVLGMAEFVMGWGLGIAESIAAVIVVGFSVDYVVHLAHMYEECEEPDRDARVTHSLARMGVTVLAGGITTAGAGAFMLGCSMTFFTKMAVLMVSTICSSLVYANGFFISLCAMAGPCGETGDIRALIASLRGSKDSVVPRHARAEAAAAAGESKDAV